MCSAQADASVAALPVPQQVKQHAAPAYVPPPLDSCGDVAPDLDQAPVAAAQGAPSRRAPDPSGPAGDGLPFSIKTERLSSGLMATGIVFIPIGAIGMIAGTTAYVVAASEDPGDYDYYDSGADAESDAPNIGPAFMAVGGMMMVGGIIMTAVGAQKIPVITGQSTSLIPTVSVSPSQATLSWTF